MNFDIMELMKWKAGYAADPSIEILLAKDKLAHIRVKELEAKISDLERSLEIARMTRDALKEQYQLK